VFGLWLPVARVMLCDGLPEERKTLPLFDDPAL